MNKGIEIQQYIEKIDQARLGLYDCKEKPIIIGSYSGESNKVHFIKFGSKPFVLKINGVSGKDLEFFEREYHKLKALESFEVAPRAYIYDEDSLKNQSMILEMIEGKTLMGEKMGSYLEQILNSLNSMAEISPEILRNKKGFKRDIDSCWDYVHMFPFHAQRQIAEYADRVGEDDIYRLSRTATEKGVEKINEKREAFDNSQMGLVHTGLHPENIIYTPNGKIRFIDWEHSSVGDRAFEISSLLRSNDFSNKDIEKILNQYQGKTGDFRTRVDLYTDIFRVHEVLWHALRLDKTKKGELNLSENRTVNYYQELLEKHLQNLKNSNLI